jgi:5-methylcytosine-specific restriction endonuclease McrA
MSAWTHADIVDFYQRYYRCTSRPRWQRLKRRFRKACGQRCTAPCDLVPDGRCPNTENLTVHHVSYDNLGRERYADLRLLCRSCHRQLHVLERVRRSEGQA